jgi:CheY-like chemotaxis protein
VSREYQADLPEVKADPHQLEQVFLNLIMNAQHAMEDRGGRLILRAFADEQRKHLLLEISDEGQGISPKDQKKIFDPFFSTKEPGKGTGLGLSTSMSIIENHFGKLWLESEEGAGTTVRIKLPLNLEELRQIKDDQAASPAEPGSGQLPRVLVVDDEQHIQDILSEALATEGMEPVCCFNGEEALQLLDAKHFDLLLLDMRMPLFDGLSLIKSIREKKVRLPIIVITGMASHDEITEALSQGVYKCIRKPFHIKSLLKDVKEVLVREGVLRQPAEPDLSNGR